MTGLSHKIYISILSAITFIVLIFLIYQGVNYYNTSIEERFYHPDHTILKPSGALGHGMGIFGSLFMIIGVSSYMARKRYRSLARWGQLKHWLEFHIFLCTLGPILVLFHTSFKFGGIVAVSFWSMVAVFLSGIIGRFIYIQIPRTIEGRELSLNELRDIKGSIGEVLKSDFNLDENSFQAILESTDRKFEVYSGNAISQFFKKYSEDKKIKRKVKKILKNANLPLNDYRTLVKLVANEISLNRRIDRLTTMQNLFKYWHVAHLPFALVMLIIMVIHIVVTIVFGYRWIF